jgi:membrane protease YdiL (CAAX protease family)
MTTARNGSPSSKVTTATATAPGSPDEGRSARAWTWMAAGEVLLATLVVLADWFLPAVVLVGMAALSLALRRRGPRSVGFHRPGHPWRLVGQMAGFAAGWSLLNVALLIPVVNHVSGRRQDVSAFADLEGNLGLLLIYLAAAWVVAATCEEVAFRGYLLTRITDVLGHGRVGVVTAVAISSVLFGLLHTEQGLVGITVSAFAAAVFSVLRYRCRTLWAPIMAHGFDDTIGFIWFFYFGPLNGLW